MKGKKMPATLLSTGPANETKVRSIVAPAPTDTWMPIGHDVLLDELDMALDELGVVIDTNSRKFGLQRDGLQMFGIYNVIGHDNDELGMGFSLGLRNSMDKTLSAALCFGARVFVCDNLAFSGEKTIARKHTKQIMRDLPVLIREALKDFEVFKLAQERLYFGMQGIFLEDINAHDFVIKAMDCGAIKPTAVPHVLAEYRKPQHEEFQPRNMWSLYNAFTAVAKPMFVRNPQTASDRTIQLARLVRSEFADELEEENSLIGSFDIDYDDGVSVG